MGVIQGEPYLGTGQEATLLNPGELWQWWKAKEAEIHGRSSPTFLVPGGIGKLAAPSVEKISSRSASTESIGADSSALLRLDIPILRLGRSVTGTTAKSLI